jgi:hypothetical protein
MEPKIIMRFLYLTILRVPMQIGARTTRKKIPYTYFAQYFGKPTDGESRASKFQVKLFKTI